MKKIFLFIVASALGFQVGAQSIDKIITREYTDYLIKTINSDDMQGRATFTPGIDKAASFIEAEFKKIGLQPLVGEKNFRQTFYKYQVTILNTTVKINGEEIKPEDLIVTGVNSENASLNLSNTIVKRFDTEKPFVEQLRAVMNEKSNQFIRSKIPIRKE